MKHLMQIIGTADHAFPLPLFLRDADVDARDGLGAVVLTNDPDRAQAFESAAAVFAAWQQQSSVRPLRDDGRPNKPLTAFTVQTVQIPDGGNDAAK